MPFITPEVLILSNRHDFSADYVAAALFDRGVSYLRLNSEDLPHMEVTMFPERQELVGHSNALEFQVNARHLRSIYFRQPVFLRECSGQSLTAEDQMIRTQWAAFMRSVVIFDQQRWINHPKETYAAEIKPYQLLTAKRLGFSIPETVVANTTKNTAYTPQEDIVLKSLDTLIVRDRGQEAFAYSTVLQMASLGASDMASSPAILQEYIRPKRDIRVTVVGASVFAVEIVADGRGVEGDWRLMKDTVRFLPTKLPQNVEESCVEVRRAFGLIFGAIDLAESNGDYFFLEINPTGEWAWLTATLNLPIDEAIANCLAEECK